MVIFIWDFFVSVTKNAQFPFSLKLEQIGYGLEVLTEMFPDPPGWGF